jgi:hypothetical protein
MSNVFGIVDFTGVGRIRIVVFPALLGLTDILYQLEVT